MAKRISSLGCAGGGAGAHRVERTGSKRNLAGVLALTVLLLCSCGTVSSRTHGGGGPYHGLGYDMEKLSSGDEWLNWSGQGTAGNVPFWWPRGLLWLVDAPLSLVADTLMLPVDAIRPKAAETEAESNVGEDVDAAKRNQFP